MQDGFWSVFSETGDVVGYLLCRAAENASRADGGPAPVGVGKAQVHAAHASWTREAAHAAASASASPAAGIASAARGAPTERAARAMSGESGAKGGGGVSV